MQKLDGIFDVAIVGGGINGCGIARDATGRGARVLLLERADLASGTSSASTKLIHGGLRYLEHREFGLVRESLAEREVLWGIAPHLIQPMRFVLPLAPGSRPRLVVRAGLFLYDHLGGRRDLPPARSIRFDRHPAGAALKSSVTTGFEYSDCWCDDARLVVANARDAARRGATILTRTAIAGARREGGLWVLDADGRRFAARALVNAAGPQFTPVSEHIAEAPAPPLRLVRGSHIVVGKIFDHPFAYLFQNDDGRVVFAIPYEGDFTLIGTTDVDHPDPLQPPRASDAEVDYLLTAANAQFAIQLERASVVSTFSGVRPLVADESGKPEAASRGYRLDLSPESHGAPLLNVLGGKLTTYRHLGERAVDMLAGRLASIGKPAWTGTTPLPGGDFDKLELASQVRELADAYPFLTGRECERLTKAYGTEAQLWLGSATRRQDLGEDFGAGLSEAEVRWMIDAEFARTPDDILWRRSKLGLHMSADQQQRLRGFVEEKHR